MVWYVLFGALGAFGLVCALWVLAGCWLLPHLMRLAVGNNHVYLLPGSAMAGALLLLLGDLLARTVISPVILPIGAITSFLGGPLFLWLIMRRRNIQ